LEKCFLSYNLFGGTSISKKHGFSNVGNNINVNLESRRNVGDITLFKRIQGANVVFKPIYMSMGN
jgi:hypothetical protein